MMPMPIPANPGRRAFALSKSFCVAKELRGESATTRRSIEDTAWGWNGGISIGDSTRSLSGPGSLVRRIVALAVVVAGYCPFKLAQAQILQPSSGALLSTASGSDVLVDWASPPKLTLKGMGPIRIGMTYAEVGAVASGGLNPATIPNEPCYFVRPAAAPKGIELMFVDGRLARIDVTGPSFSSGSGARVGQSQTDVLKRYNNRLEIEGHKYHERWKYLTFVPKDETDSSYRMVFETDGNKVTEFRAGKLPEVEFVERCG